MLQMSRTSSSVIVVVSVDDADECEGRRRFRFVSSYENLSDRPLNVGCK